MIALNNNNILDLTSVLISSWSSIAITIAGRWVVITGRIVVHRSSAVWRA